MNPVTEPLPVLISKRKIQAALPNQLDHAVTVNRHPARRAVYRLAASAMRSFRGFLGDQEFTEIQTPKIVASATESGANVFWGELLKRTGHPAGATEATLVAQRLRRAAANSN